MVGSMQNILLVMYISDKIGRYALGILLCFCGFHLWGDNLRINGPLNCVVTSDHQAEIELKVTWANSWRNSCNYDAIYLFGKFRIADQAGWMHLFFDPAAEAHTVGSGYEVKVVNGGRGIFLYRSEDGQGLGEATLRLKWKLDGNVQQTVTPEQVSRGEVWTSVQGMEMVYVPTAPFYAGDGLSENSFSSPWLGVLPEAYDMIGTNSTYTYSASVNASLAANPADHLNQAIYDETNRHDWNSNTGVFPTWWQVDFKAPKRILYFGVSGLCWQVSVPAPATTWYLEGSATAAVNSWTEVWSGGPEYWGQSSVSYPIQKAIRVTNPGDYRYYRIRIEDSQRKNTWNNIHIANIAMTENDLAAEGGAPLLQAGDSPALPSRYANGVEGFYAMKYELTQEQYVTFLNQLNRAAQYTHTIGGLLDGIKEGEYVYGEDRNTPSFRNGIIVQERRLNSHDPYLFACNLNPDNVSNSLNDGQNIACNYLSPANLLAYADWCGLRPLSELEYEKMCRGIYPAKPGSPDYAWGNKVPQKATGWTDEGKETERPVSGNVNADHSLPGPARVGAFVRSGERENTGCSVLGISGLTGNLNEIYVNTEIFGKQFDGSVQGSGSLTVDGNHTIDRKYWPVEPEAYGVRGGDFSASFQELTVANRKNMTGNFFREMTDRNPVAGVRLGFSLAPERQKTVLTLENGLISGEAVVYDTVCDASEYVIKGENSGKQYLWLISEDNGASWKLLENEGKKDLRLSDLTVQMAPNTLNRWWYKRLSFDNQSVQESGIVGLIISYGLELDRLKDTIQACMAIKGFTAKTKLPAMFEWSCLDNQKMLNRSEGYETSSHSDFVAADLTSGEERPSGWYTIEVKATYAAKCVIRERMEILVQPNTLKPFAVEDVVLTYSGDAYQLPNAWTGEAQVWKILNTEKGSLEISNRGVLSGLSETMCRHIVVEASCKDEPGKVYRREIHEPERIFTCIKNVWPVNLLPGEYEVECWGGDGGIGYGNTNPIGYGGYVKGRISFAQSQPLFLYIGEGGVSTNTTPAYNGGGASYASSGHNGGRGGGATDIRLVGGTWNNPASLQSRIMVAGGGGGAMPSCGGNRATAGHAGGLEGSYSLNQAGTYVNNCSYGGTQTAGGTFRLGSNASNNGVRGAFGIGANAGTCAGGGGSGYYGGASLYTSGGGGGSSFISGYAGCDAVDENGKHTGQAVHYSGLVFTDMEMISGALNVAHRSPDGHGRIVIKLIEAGK